MSESVTVKVEAEVSIYAVSVHGEVVNFDMSTDRDGEML